MDLEDSKAIARFFATIGGILLATGLTAAVTLYSAQASIPYKVIIVIAGIGVVGIVFLSAGVFWHRIEPKGESRLTTQLAAWASSPLPYTLIISAAWAYIAATSLMSQVQRNNEIVSLRNDELSIAQVLARFVLPRKLCEDQIATIAFFLQKFPPANVTFYVATGDDEAGFYRVDLQKALERGGWHTKAILPIPDPTNAGLSISANSVTNQTDLKHQSSDLILQEALGLAGVRINGSTGTTSEDSVTITIGHRPRDYYVPPCPPRAD